MIFTFPYREERGVDPSPADPDRPVFRPKVPLKLAGPRGDDAIAVALVDTGADETVVPLSLARTLKVRLDSRIYTLFGSEGRPFAVQYGVVRLTIALPGVGEYSWESRVGFQKHRRNTVLGRAGCLDRLAVMFDGPNRRVVITTPDGD